MNFQLVVADFLPISSHPCWVNYKGDGWIDKLAYDKLHAYEECEYIQILSYSRYPSISAIIEMTNWISYWALCTI